MLASCVCARRGRPRAAQAWAHAVARSGWRDLGRAVRLSGSWLRALLVTSGRPPVFLREVRRVSGPSKHAHAAKLDAQLFAPWHDGSLDGAGDATVPTDGPIACQRVCQSQSQCQSQRRCRCPVLDRHANANAIAARRWASQRHCSVVHLQNPLAAVPLLASFPDIPRL